MSARAILRVGLLFGLLVHAGCKKERVPPPPSAAPEPTPVAAPLASSVPTAPPIFDPAGAPGPAPAPAPATDGGAGATASAMAATDSIALERTACFGTCPDYKVTLRGDGTMTWHGLMYVDTKNASAKVDAAMVRVIFDYATSKGFFGWRDTYHAPITDHPSIRITLTTKGRSKTVDVNPSTPDYAKQSGAPLAAYEIATRIDGLAGSKRYIGKGSPR